MAHLSTINPDGSPQVTVIWIGLDPAWDLLNRLPKTYMSPDAEFPAPQGPGYIVRYEPERISGVGPWVPHGG
jgi:hypothetical protein